MNAKPNIKEWTFLFLALLYGFVAAYVSIVVTLTWIVLVLYACTGLSKNNKHRIWQCIVASPFIEVLGRMTKAPLLPIEMGKYFLMLSVILLLIYWLKNSGSPSLYKTGIIIIIILLPSFAFSLITLEFNYEDWVFNVFGILEIALLLFFAAMERWTEEELVKAIKIAIFISFPIAINATAKSRELNGAEFALGSQGALPNQLSTMFGAAAFIICMSVIFNKKLFKPIVGYILAGCFIFRGLLTFSRGGVIVSLLAILILHLPVMFKSKTSSIKSFFILFFLIGGGTGIFIIANRISDNQLLLRYEGETNGTLSGSKEKTLNTITTSRLDIARTDIDIFNDNSLLGVGPGQARYYREKYGGFNVVAHVEFTRLLSEHGIGGLLVVFVLIIFPVWYVSHIKSKMGKAFSTASFTLALLTTFHAAMRTNTTVAFYVLGAIPVSYVDRRKRKIISYDKASIPENN